MWVLDERPGVLEVAVDALDGGRHAVLLQRRKQKKRAGGRFSEEKEKEMEGGRERTALISSPRALALRICFSSVVAVLRAAVRCSWVSLRMPEPTPRTSTRSAQKYWREGGKGKG